MQERADERRWRLDDDEPAGAMQVAARLARCEDLGALCYRDVELEATVVDVTPCRGTLGPVFYRFVRLRSLRWPSLRSPSRDQPPDEWQSEAVSIPRQARDGLESHLARFETEYFVYSFLRQVERAIDDVLGCCAMTTERTGA